MHKCKERKFCMELTDNFMSASSCTKPVVDYGQSMAISWNNTYCNITYCCLNLNICVNVYINSILVNLNQIIKNLKRVWPVTNNWFFSISTQPWSMSQKQHIAPHRHLETSVIHVATQKTKHLHLTRSVQNHHISYFISFSVNFQT